ncbi:MAG: hypothetical protein JRF50_05185 [Deltaproteobacteria bacterium]|nr:hypothetical protein [Deltaproteobacteria bacterium]
MKTTLNINDVVMKLLKEESVKQGKTLSEVVEMALRGLFQQRQLTSDLPPLPSFKSGGGLVDLANWNSLYEVMGRP